MEKTYKYVLEYTYILEILYIYCTYSKSTWAVRKKRAVLVFHDIVFRVDTNCRIRLKCPFVSENLTR